MPKRKLKGKTVTDSSARNAALLTDGCNPELVEGARFDGIFEIPIIYKPTILEKTAEVLIGI